MDPTGMEESVKRWLLDPVVGRIIATLLGTVVILGLFRLLNRSLARRLKDLDTRYRTRKFITFGGYLVVIFYLALVYKNQLGGLTIAFGMAGAGIAFALQEVIASIAGWVAVSFGGFYRTGDRIQLGGIMGDVIDIGILRTTLMECGQWVKGDLYNGRIVLVANSFVFKEPVLNYSGDFEFLWDEIVVPVRFGSDVRQAREILEKAVTEIAAEYVSQARLAWQEMVRRYRIEDARIDPMVTLIANDNWIEFTVRYIVDYRRRRVTKDRLFTRILEEVDRAAPRVQLASATFELVQAPPLDVRLAGGPSRAPVAADESAGT